MPNSARPSLAMSHLNVRKLCRVFLKTCLLGIVFLPLHLIAQVGSATLTGTVTDPSGALLPNTLVTATNEETGITVKSQSTRAGVYTIEALNPGRYRVTVEHQGFKQIEVNGLELHTQDIISRNFALPVGATSETIQVEGNKNATNDSPAVSLTVTHDFIEAIPLNGGSLQDLIALTPGAVSSAQRDGLYSINGQHDDSNYFTVDGVAANTYAGVPAQAGGAQAVAGVIPAQTALGTTQSLASLDSLQEFKIQTTGYTAEYGRQPGGQIQLTTRSGADRVSGSLFDYFRNDALDANSWFANHDNVPRQGEHQNDFGGTLGGAVEIPKIYNGHGRTFYFLSYEGLTLRTPTFFYDLDVPSASLRQAAAPVMAQLLNSLPLPNSAPSGDYCLASLGPSYSNDSCSGGWSGGSSNPQKLNNWSARLDHSINSRNQVFARFQNTQSQSASYDYISQLFSNVSNARNLTVGATSKITSLALNEFHFNYTENKAAFNGAPATAFGAMPYSRTDVFPSQFSSPAINDASSTYISIPNEDYIQLPGYLTGFNLQHQYNYTDSLTWSMGPHTLKWGGDFRRLSPQYTPLGGYSDQLYVESLTGLQEGYADSAFVFATATAHPLIHNLSLFAQDHWAINKSISFDYGLRWEFNPAPGASDGIYPLALTTSNLSEVQIAPTGTPQYHTIFHDFAPRLGFTFAPFRVKGDSTVFRGGIGVFYDTGQALASAGYDDFPFYNYTSPNDVYLPAATSSALNPPSLTVSPTPPFGTTADDPNLKIPYTYEWSLSVDHALTARDTLTASYVGNSGKKLLYQAVYSNPTPALSYLNLTTNAGASNYNALQVQNQGRLSNGLDLILSYAFAHAIDNASNDTPANSPVRGNSDNDVRQNLNIALTYKIPGLAEPGLLEAISRRWALSARVAAQSGFPLDILQNIYNLPNGEQSNIRPNLVPNVPIYLKNVEGVLGGWALNRAAFSPVPLNPDGSPTVLGALGRNEIRGPNFWGGNCSLERSFPIHDHTQLTFKTEAFNVLNHPNAGRIGTTLDSGGFGVSGSVPEVGTTSNSFYSFGAPRSLQLSLKIQF
jgi:hypothetical protein